MSTETIIKILKEACDSSQHLKSAFEYCRATYEKDTNDHIMLAQAIKAIREQLADEDATSELYHTASWIEHSYNLDASRNMSVHDLVNYMKSTMTIE